MFESLRRWPDVEGHGLMAVDAADLLILDHFRDQASQPKPGETVVIGDSYGALTLGLAAGGVAGIRTHTDAITGERALSANATRLHLSESYTLHPLDRSLVSSARHVLVRLPRSLEALHDVAGLIAAYANPDVVVVAGGRIKHMTVAMNSILREFFERVDVSHARQKSRVLLARGPHDGCDPAAAAGTVAGLEIRAYGGVFAGPRLDIGTRLLLDHLPSPPPGGTVDDPWIDMACGTGIVAAWLASRFPDGHAYASDHSAIAVKSATATMDANGLSSQVRVVQDDALRARPSASASFIALNPPFHSGGAVTDQLAPRLFADAARVLRPGGQLWCVWNSPLRYRAALDHAVGPTTQVARNAKFTVTLSTRR